MPKTINKKMDDYQDFRQYMIEQLRSHPEDIETYIETAVEDYENDKDKSAFLLALRTVAEAKASMTELSRKTKLTRSALYKALSPSGNPRLETIWSILNALGYSLAVKPLR